MDLGRLVGIRVDFSEEAAVEQIGSLKRMNHEGLGKVYPNPGIGTCIGPEAGRSLAFFEKGQLGEQPKGQSVLESQRTLGGVTNTQLYLHVDSVFVLRIKGEPWVQ